MSTDDANSPRGSVHAVQSEACRWVIRHDRGLTASEVSEFTRWLAASPQHTRAFDAAMGSWERLGRLPLRPLAAASQRTARRNRWLRAVVPVAAAVALAAFTFHASRSRGQANAAEASGSAVVAEAPRTRALPDGSVIRLNRGAQLHELYSSTSRTVRLLKGEAYFDVARDAQRPFVVEVGEVAVRAVGTAFNINRQAQSVNVLVTEGTVQVQRMESHDGSTPTRGLPAEPAASLVTAGHGVTLPLEAVALPVRIPIAAEKMDPQTVERLLAWREPLMRMGGATLAEVAGEFERFTGRRMVLKSPALAELQIGGSFPSDDVDGFVRVLEMHYGVVVRSGPDGSLELDRPR